MVWSFKTDDERLSGFVRASSAAHAFQILGTEESTLWPVSEDSWREDSESGVVFIEKATVE